ncbi:MAG: hypothetical protein OZSIB_4362 [Candidatus Ozemobacter sibiricus]|jgi:flagellar hook-length control protein FliK|uniref:Flagellar hook-length control protein-like C-terminal domain-containing protein n=1 Tax=Candidatus Ozemobacter sibiricus TaxID=2268124 RepID=A0A367ZAW7_9BACT|nr:MAG: hypothetical protein OZSIB_4362 [Candidatus Ozemobacter sibiricus]
MIANLASIDLLDLLGVETAPALPQNAPSPQEFAKSLREAMARPRPDPARTSQGARPPEARRDGPGFRPLFLRDRLSPGPPTTPSPRAKNEAAPSRSSAPPQEANSPTSDVETAVSPEGPTTLPEEPGITPTPTADDGLSVDRSELGEAARPTAPEESQGFDQSLPEAARRLLEQLSLILQKLQETRDSPDDRQALIDSLQADPIFGPLLEVLSQATGQSSSDLLATYPAEQVFEPLQKVLTLLATPESPLPDSVGQALEQAFQDNPLWKDVHPETARRAVEDLLAKALPTFSLTAAERPLTPAEAGGLPAAPSRKTSDQSGKSQPATPQTSSPEAGEAIPDRPSGPTASTTPFRPQAHAGEQGTSSGLVREEHGHPTCSPLQAQAPSPTVAATDLAVSALTAEEGHAPQPAGKPALDPAAVAAALKGSRAQAAQPAGNAGSHGWGFNPGDRPPERISPSAPRPADPIRGALFSQIIEKAELFKVGSEKKVLTLQLRPESLGKLNIELTSKDGTVSARITTEHAMVREKLDQLVPQIKDTLATQGIKLDQVTVDISHQNPDGRKEQTFQGQGGSFRSVAAPAREEAGPIQDVRPALRRLALNIRMVDLTV